MILEQIVTKATLLVDEAEYPARYKDGMVQNTLIVCHGTNYQLHN